MRSAFHEYPLPVSPHAVADAARPRTEFCSQNSAGRILVADDDPNYLKATLNVLRRGGYSCEGAADARQATALLGEKDYDLLISDVEMPGNRELRFIRDLPQISQGLPVILMTGYPTIETAIQSVNLPVTSYLVKPFESEALFSKVRQAIRNRAACHAVSASHQRIQEWTRALEEVNNAIQSSRQTAAAPWQTLFDLTLTNISASLDDLRVFAGQLGDTQSAQPDAEPAQSARPVLLLNALRDTIAVLEKTRSSFRSKDLGELRARLETLVEGNR